MIRLIVPRGHVAIFSDTTKVINVETLHDGTAYFLGHYKGDKCQTLHDGTAYHFQLLWTYFKVTAVSKSFNWKLYVVIRLSWNFAGLQSTSSRS